MTRIMPVRDRPTIRMAVAPGAGAASASADEAHARAAESAAAAAASLASESAAAVSAAAAFVAETNAGTAQTNAVIAQAAAEAAQAAAQAAQSAAETAEANAETAEANAQTAETSAGASATEAAAARDAALTAQTGAELAETNAEAAQGNAAAALAATEVARDTALAVYADLDGGTTNQVLIKASNTDFDFGWQTFVSMSAMTYDPQNIADDAFDRTNHTGAQTLATISDAGSAAAADAGDFATAAQGAMADSAVQPGDLATTSAVGVVEKATDAETRSAAADKFIAADNIETASAPVALTDAPAVAVDWDSGINFSLTVTGHRVIGNPSNGQPGTYRSILVQGSDGTDRTITFGDQYLGAVPTITDCDNAKWYLLTIRCITITHFVVAAQVAKT